MTCAMRLGRRLFDRRNAALLFAVACAMASLTVLHANDRPNVVFIAIDDQNDWIGCLGGHPLARTPHLDALAARGTVFLNAQCQAPLCNPSRTSLMFGLRPSSTGIYGLSPWIRSLPEFKDRVSLTQHFKAGGYRTLMAGKIHHGGVGGPAARAAEADEWGPSGGIGVKPPQKLIPPTPTGNHPLMDWGAFPHDDSQKGDFLVADWAVERIRKLPADEPFFLAAGFFLPHVPCYASPRWFDPFPDDDRVLPAVRDDDRNDVPLFAWKLHWKLPEPRLKWVREQNQWRNLVRSYLACTHFVDAQIGRVLAAIDESGRRERTIVVVWGDHGWHLGEKGITGKNTVWERSARVPLIFAGPSVTAGQRCTQPAELLDMFPTLIDLCRLSPRTDLEGLSLAPQLQRASTPRERPAITTHNAGNHGVRSERHRFIRYVDGSEEFYDLVDDPHEWTNRVNDASLAAVIAEHRRWLPANDRPPAPGSAHRVLTFDRETGRATWEGEPIDPSDAVPE